MGNGKNPLDDIPEEAVMKFPWKLVIVGTAVWGFILYLVW